MITQVSTVKDVVERAVREHWSAHALNATLAKGWGEEACHDLLEKEAIVSFLENGKRVSLRVIKGRVIAVNIPTPPDRN